MARLFNRLSQQAVQRPTLLKHGLDKMMDDAEAKITDIEDTQTELAATQADLANAITDLQGANTRLKIGFSFTSPADVVTATDAGTSVTVTVAAHVRIYGDGSQLSVSGHTFTGKSYSQDAGIYYNDSTCSDTTPTYVYTTNPTQAQNNYAVGRHRLAVFTTPAAGTPDVQAGSTPSGGGHDNLAYYNTP